MIILLPNTSEQTISVTPRYTDYFSKESYEDRVESDGGIVEAVSCLTDIASEFNNTSISIRRDGDGKSEIITDVKGLVNGNFIDFTFASSILEEGSTYYLEITDDSNLVYRDKIYSTAQTNYTVKHKVSQTKYQTYSSLDNNTYII